MGLVVKDLARDKVSEYANDHLTIATKYFNEFFRTRKNSINDPRELKLSLQTTISEWKTFKNDIKLNFVASSNNILTKRVLNSVFYPNLSQLYAFFLIIPLTTAECERSFSRMNLIKTDLRINLAHETLDNLMFTW